MAGEMGEAWDGNIAGKRYYRHEPGHGKKILWQRLPLHPAGAGAVLPGKSEQCRCTDFPSIPDFSSVCS